MQRLAAERGLTLIEVSILLVTTLAIVGALAPTMSAVVMRAETTSASTTMSTISQAIGNALSDMNMIEFNYDGLKGSAQRVLLMVGDGDTPREVSITGDATWQQPVNYSTVEFMENHLVVN